MIYHTLPNIVGGGVGFLFLFSWLYYDQIGSVLWAYNFINRLSFCTLFLRNHNLWFIFAGIFSLKTFLTGWLYLSYLNLISFFC